MSVRVTRMYIFSHFRLKRTINCCELIYSIESAPIKPDYLVNFFSDVDGIEGKKRLNWYNMLCVDGFLICSD